MKTTRREAIMYHLRNEFNIKRHFDLLDAIIPFYLSNTNITNSQIIQQIKKVIEYREKHHLFGQCEKCQKERVHTMTYIGDNETDSIILFQPSISSDLDSYSVQRHLMNEMIKALTNKNTVIWLFDFNNYPFSHINSHKGIVFTICKFLYNCFFNQVSKFIILNPPSYAYPLILMAKKVLKTDIENKIQIISLKEPIFYKYALIENGIPSCFHSYIAKEKIADFI